MVKRAKKVVKGALIILVIGALYAVAVHYFGRGIPCVFRLVTGLKCPGCGATGMCMHLLELDFKNARNSNAVLLFMLPFLTAVAARLIYLYIKRGSTYDKFSKIAIYIMIAVLLIWGVVRNII